MNQSDPIAVFPFHPGVYSLVEQMMTRFSVDMNDMNDMNDKNDMNDLNDMNDMNDMSTRFATSGAPDQKKRWSMSPGIRADYYDPLVCRFCRLGVSAECT